MVTDTAPFRDPSYHRAGDVIGNVDLERLARVMRQTSLARCAAGTDDVEPLERRDFLD